MIPALLHHKLSVKQTNMEDILTSNVFGMFMYHAQPKSGLFRFLARATTIDGCRPLASLLDDPAEVTVEYDFWPRWKHEGKQIEPDVAPNIVAGASYFVGIEAKYWSGKSSRAVEEVEPDEDSDDEPEDDEAERHPSDQLAKEWKKTVVEAMKRNTQPVLIYLTADLHCPRQELLDSIKDCGKPSPGSPTPLMCWLSWRELPGLFRNTSELHLADLAALADEMGLTFFEGFSDVSPIRLDWGFQGPAWRFDVTPITCDWRFKQ